MTFNCECVSDRTCSAVSFPSLSFTHEKTNDDDNDCKYMRKTKKFNEKKKSKQLKRV